MYKQFLSLMLVGLLINLMTVNFAFAESDKELRRVEKVRQGIFKLGTGKDARVEVKLRDKTKVRGYISQADDNGFAVVDLKTGASTNVVYPNVKQVRGNNLSTGAKIAIGVGIGAGITLLIFLIWLNSADD